MRALVFLALVGCTDGVVQNPDTDTTAGDCSAAGSDYVPASSSTFSFNNILINGITVGVDMSAVQGCVKSGGNGAAWLIDNTGGDPLMAVVTESDETGSLPVTSGLFLVDIYGWDPPIAFEGDDWFTNQWVVNSLEPFSTTFQGSATNSGNHQMEVNFFATATP